MSELTFEILAPKLLTLTHAFSITTLVAITMYPHEWGALTNTGKNILEKLDVPDQTPKSAGFNERYNLVLEYGDGSAKGFGTYVYEVKCNEYEAAEGNFKSHCKQIKMYRLIFSALIAIVVLFKVAELTERKTIVGYSCTPKLLRSLGVLLSVVILAFSARICHLFRTDTASIGSLNQHGHTYFGLTVFFSLALMLASVGTMVVNSKKGVAEKLSQVRSGNDTELNLL